MGDRGNVYILDDLKEDTPGVYLYSHWGGYELPQMVARALVRADADRQNRWDDAPYLTRIIFCEMVKGYEEETTGFGISARRCDNEYPIVVVQPGNNPQIGLAPEGQENGGIESCTETWSFAEFIAKFGVTARTETRR